MLKVIENELMSSYYMIHRLVLLATRAKGIPKSEPSGIHVTSAHHQRNFNLNDIDAYQESSNVKLFIDHKRNTGPQLH
jgi:hypothetical protein